MTHAAHNISVVICAYTEARWDALVQAVESVRRQSLPAHEIVVVIDHNPCLFARAQAELSGVVPLENQEQQGLSGARNTGIVASNGTIIAFLDDDAVAALDWLERLSQGYTDPQILGVGGSIHPTWLDGQPRWFPEEFNWVVGCTYRGLPQATASIRNLIGANMSFRREIFDGVTRFQSGVGQVGASMLRCDDTEFCIRLRQRRPEAMLLYKPDAQVYHQVPSSRARWSYFRSRCFTEGLAKAQVSQLVGSKDGLASERIYTFRTLPAGVVRGLADTVLQGELDGLMHAAAIISGLALTTAGYLVGLMSNRLTINLAKHKSSLAEKGSLL